MPKRVSEKTKKLQGTLQPCRARKTVKKTVWNDCIALSTDPPEGLDADGQKAWETAVKFAPKGTLTPADAHLLKRWCDCYSQYEYLKNHNNRSEMLTTNVQGNPMIAPWAMLMRSLSSDMLKLEKELGFTPCARARVRVVDSEDKPANPFFEVDD